MESIEALLRDELDRPPTYVRASVSDLIAKTRRIRRRRNLTAGFSAAVAVLAVSALTVTLSHSARAIDPADRPHPSPSSAMAQLLTGGGLPVGGRFIDSEHAVMLVTHCPAHIESLDSCAVSVEASSDGGLTFQNRTMPAEANLYTVNLYVFDNQDLVLDRPAAVDAEDLPLPSNQPTAAPGSSDGPSAAPTGPISAPLTPPARWVSHDGGVTWSSVTPTPGSPVLVIPAGAQIVNPGESTPEVPAAPTVMTMDGVAHPLANAPAHAIAPRSFSAPNTYSGEIAGCYFLYLADPNFGLSGLVVSRDQGRTWHNAGISGDASLLVPIGAAGNRLYVGTIDFSNPDTSHIYLSTDHAVSWTPLDLPVAPSPTGASSTAIQASSPADPVPPDQAADGVQPTAAVLADGGLIYSDGARLWKVDPDGQTFHPADGDGVTTYATAGVGTLAFAVRSAGADRVTLATTTDGVHWRTMALAN